MNEDQIKKYTAQIKKIERAIDILRSEENLVDDEIINLLISEMIEREISIDTLILNRK